jgi:protein O-GlcNAc transferase
MTTAAQSQAIDLQALLRQSIDHQNAGRFLEASQGYIRVLQQSPDHWPTYYNLAIAFQGLGRLDDARLALERAAVINPKSAQVLNNLGNIHKIQNRPDEAERAYIGALAIDLNLPQALYNLALVQQARGQFTASAESLARVVKIVPTHDEAWDALYRMLLALKRVDEGIAAFLSWEAAVVYSPLLTAAGLALCRTIGGADRETKYVRLAVEWPFADATPAQLAPILGMIQYFDVSPEEVLACYQRFNEALEKTIDRPVALLPRRSVGSKLRIGYVSCDFRRHVMGQLMKDVFDAHDRSRIELTLVSLCENMFHDELTTKFKALADRFLDVAALSDFDAAKLIAEADLDILVDLAGQTMGVRPTIYAYRPARCIVTHLGYHGCLGLSSVDYKITDRVADLPEMAKFQIEKPYFLESCLFPFRHISSTDEEEKVSLAMRSSLGLEEKFVFGTFVNILKLSPRCVQAWKKILDRTPHSVIAFSPIAANEAPGFIRLMASAGIEASRVKFIPAAKTDGGQRARYLLVDAVLDTFPYAGGDTTLAALDRDVPVVSLVGKRNAERVGASILTHVGVTETLCNSEAEYIESAVRLTQDEPWRMHLKGRLNEARRTSPFYLVATHTRALERAYGDICARTSSVTSTLTAQEFSTRFQAALRHHQAASNGAAIAEVDAEYQALAEAQPEYLPLFQLRATIAKLRNQPERAMQLLRTASELSPQDGSIAVLYATSLLEANECHQALAIVDALPTARIEQADTLMLKARSLTRLGRFEDALPFAQRANARLPNDPNVGFVLATLLATMDRTDEALAVYRNVLALKPDHVEALLNVAQLFLANGDPAQAESLLRRALQLKPPHELAYAKLADLLQSQGKVDAWVGLAKMFASTFPRSLRAKAVEAESQRYLSNFMIENKQFETLTDLLIAVDDDNVVLDLAPAILRRALAVNLLHEKAEKLRLRFDTALAALHDVIPQSELFNSVHEEISIGFLIDRLEDDERSRAAVSLVNAYASRLGSVALYCLAADKRSVDFKLAYDFSETGFSENVEMHSLTGLGATTAANQIRKAKLSVLVDLCGFRHPLAAQILVQRVAGLQIANGAFGEMAESSWFDLRLFDAGTRLPLWEAHGPSAAMMQCVALVPLPLNSAESERVMQVAAVREVIVFAIGAAVDCVSVEVAGLWRLILDKVPNSVLAVPATTELALRQYQRVLGLTGIAVHRIVALAKMADERSRFATSHIVLDNKPASDPFLASECLRASLPLVTARGPTGAERLAYSVLLQCGLSELVAESGQDYVQLAVRLATDAAWRTELSAKMRERIDSNMLDAERDIEVMRTALKQARADVPHG